MLLCPGVQYVRAVAIELHELSLLLVLVYVLLMQLKVLSPPQKFVNGKSTRKVYVIVKLTSLLFLSQVEVTICLF
jgi:hypothetical protein